jgi:hypothetical protein
VKITSRVFHEEMFSYKHGELPRRNDTCKLVVNCLVLIGVDKYNCFGYVICLGKYNLHFVVFVRKGMNVFVGCGL